MLALWCGYGWGAGPWFLFFPLFWIAILAGVGLLFRRGRGHWHSNSGAAVLAERYARGEITEEEYRQRRTVLRDGPR